MDKNYNRTYKKTIANMSLDKILKYRAYQLYLKYKMPSEINWNAAKREYKNDNMLLDLLLTKMGKEELDLLIDKIEKLKGERHE